MSTETIVRTIKCPLETSDHKNQTLLEACEVNRRVMERAESMIPSFNEGQWRPNSTPVYRRVVKDGDFDDEINGMNSLKASVCREGAQKVAEQFQSWKEGGKEGERPSVSDTQRFIRLPGDEFSIVSNDRGYGLKAGFISYNTVWWHLNIGEFQEEYIQGVLDGEKSFGSMELLYNDGNPVANITVSWEKEVPDIEDVDYMLGVDLGENTLYAASALSRDGVVESVEVDAHISGREFRHNREMIDNRIAQKQGQGKLSEVRLRRKRRKYTEHVVESVSRCIAELAQDVGNCAIILEDLTYYRETQEDAIHDWPFAMFQDRITDKAQERGIPVKSINPKNTSQRCSNCGEFGDRDGVNFTCDECGYENHADVNASMNIAQRGWEAVN